MEFEIYLSHDQSGVQEKVIRESENEITAVIELGAYYKALGYEYILLGLKDDQSLDPMERVRTRMPWTILYGRWKDKEVFNV